MRLLLTSGFALLFLGCVNIEMSKVSTDYSTDQVESVADTIASELGLNKRMAIDSVPVYVTPLNKNPIYSFKALVQPADKGQNVIKILTFYGGDKAINRKLNLTFKSYFEQELYKDSLKLDLGEYVRLEPRSKKEMWKRNFINLGYGIHYAGIGHPYYEQWDGWLGVVAFGILDVAHYALIFGGPSIGKTEKEGLQVSLTGVASLLFYKLMIPWAVNEKLIDGYNSFAESKYLIPKDAIIMER